ncbi:hypothetical protein [Streptomyces ardesiacus]|uniref:hypothetical protein n=1 Tax=Streptomyces ardesiacus TaxID=285564 RepID=UPI00365D1B8C
MGAVVGLAAQIYDAVLDDCGSCRRPLMDMVVEDAGGTSILIGWACLVTSETYGGLPEILLEGPDWADAAFRPSADFRKLAAVYPEAGTASQEVRDRCIRLAAEERRKAVETAVELLVGLDRDGVDFLYF